MPRFLKHDLPVLVAALLIAIGVATAHARPASAADLLSFVLSGDIGRVEELIAGGANVDLPGPDGMTPLVVALEIRDARMVALLLAAGADPDRGHLRLDRAPFVLDPLHMAVGIAVREGDLKYMRALLEAGADPNKIIHTDGESEVTLPALSAAVGYSDRHTEAVQELIRFGADTNLNSYGGGHGQGWTNLGLAAASGNIELVRIFVEAGNPLHREAETEWSGYSNPVMEAAKDGHSHVLAVFHDEFSVNLAARDYFGCTTLDYAIAGDHHETVEFLRNAGVVPASASCELKYLPG